MLVKSTVTIFSNIKTPAHVISDIYWAAVEKLLRIKISGSFVVTVDL